MGFWGTLGKIGLGAAGIAAAPFTGGSSLLPTILGAAGAGLGAAAQGSAQNRGAKLGAQMDLESLLMAREANTQNMQVAREQEGRASGNDAWKRLLLAQRTSNPGPRPQLSPYSVKPRQASAQELEGADAMTREVMARLTGGNPIPQVTERPLEVDRGLMDAGTWERIAGIASPILGVASQFGGGLQSRPAVDPRIAMNPFPRGRA
jgi:hypothetical protein